MKRITTLALLVFCGNGWTQTFYTENFDNPFIFTNWSNIDNDSDPNGTFDMWLNVDFSNILPEFGSGSACSFSRVNGVDYTPDNVLISPPINLTGASSNNLSLLFDIGTTDDAPNSNENYSVYILSSNTLNDLLAATPVLSETLPDGAQIYSKYADLSSYAGQTVYLAFRHHNCSGEGVLVVDNISVQNLPPLEISVESVELPRFAEVNSTNTVFTNVTNQGVTDITSLTINWNDGVDHIANVPVLIPPGATVAVPHPTPLTEAAVVEKNILVGVTLVNGGPDGNLADNYGNAPFNTISQVPARMVVLEEGTGTWCTWCPAGEVAMNEMLATYPNDIIGIAVHANDPMEVTGYGSTFSSFPSFKVDRTYNGLSAIPEILDIYYTLRKSEDAPAALGGTFYQNGSNLVIDVNASFYTNLANANYRFSVVMVEDSVTGTGSGYAQQNAYSGGGFGQMGGYELLPDPVPASQMVYNHVARTLLGGINGQAGSVPSSLVDGQVVEHTFTYAPSTEVDLNHLQAYVLLLDHNTGEIVNAALLQNTLSVAEEAPAVDWVVYPNPMMDHLTIECTGMQNEYVITLYDSHGRMVSTHTVENASGITEYTIDTSKLEAGSYIVSVSDHQTSYNQTLVKY